MARYRYSDQFDPPAPFVNVTLENPTEQFGAGQFPAQVDSGADRTVLPLEIAEQLKLDEVRQIPIGGLGGEVKLLTTYLVKVRVHNLSPIVIEVVAAQSEPLVLLGRDVLNSIRLILDGPNRVLEFGE